MPSQFIRLLGRAPKDHGPLLIAQRAHVAHLLDNLLPLGPGLVHLVHVLVCVLVVKADGAHGPVAGKHDAAGAKGGEHDAQPGERGLEDVRRVLGAQGGGHFGEAAGELHVGAGAFAEGEDGGAPGGEGGVGGDVVDGEVGLAEVVCCMEVSIMV